MVLSLQDSLTELFEGLQRMLPQQAGKGRKVLLFSDGLNTYTPVDLAKHVAAAWHTFKTGKLHTVYVHGYQRGNSELGNLTIADEHDLVFVLGLYDKLGTHFSFRASLQSQPYSPVTNVTEFMFMQPEKLKGRTTLREILGAIHPVLAQMRY